LLFGAIISATDPIAVLALFKSVGAPKRLALVVDGESMFNDATSVIVFRIILSVIAGGYALTASSAASALGNFLYVLLGSLAVGVVFGVIGSLVIEKIQDNLFVETSMTVVLALTSFIIPEHFWHLSGVISVVMTGIVVGNLGETKISGGVASFINDFWEYVSVMAIAVVFFFAAVSIDVSIFQNWIPELIMVIAITLVARSLSVYSALFITNHVPFFNDEPNISSSWQHVVNWGGLRGVIPLVLVFSLPEGFAYKEQLLLYTMGVLLFSLFVNGLSISWLLKALGLDVPRKEEEIIDEESNIFEIEAARQRLKSFPDVSQERKVVAAINKKLKISEQRHRKHLEKMASYQELKASLFTQALRIERSTAKQLFLEDIINESVYFDVDGQLDIQEDALVYPEIFAERVIDKHGLVDANISFRRRLRSLKEWAWQFSVLGRMLGVTQQQLILERYMTLKARLVGNQAVIEYLDHVAAVFMEKKKSGQALAEVRLRYIKFRRHNRQELQALTKKYPKIIEKYHVKLVQGFIG
jgi:monovalent cation:H+ antiporter, CPA1 family